MLSTIFIVLLLALQIVALYFGLIRNQQVHDERLLLLREIDEQCKINMSCGRPYEHLLTFFDEVDYDTMLYKFWIPVDQFWYRWVKAKQQKGEFPV